MSDQGLPKPKEVKWAEKRLKKEVPFRQTPDGKYLIGVTDADLDKLTKMRLRDYVIPIIAGVLAAQVLIWITRYLL